MALRASELVGLQVSDVFDGEMVKNYVNIRAETAKFKKKKSVPLELVTIFRELLLISLLGRSQKANLLTWDGVTRLTWRGAIRHAVRCGKAAHLPRRKPSAH